ncbi:hypothetical protein KO494_00320 [Lacinutrix sp. C3R15]|uniref:hypothetical protein n=1 Tax=Flavobacteriaceae TaxID=49546 RepID=UPI001C087E56|nr:MULTISPECIES: hypothetical protein [Flavobacteriaceae]MBU2937971.1 hypothetical protein [Lacinutrix sp. C3R15]MDO6621285.1 hypothetical protein [Oceanihabitans sp. 1_MG-2023]
MNKIVSKYLSLIVLLLLSGAINMYANTSVDADYSLVNIQETNASFSNKQSSNLHFSIQHNKDIELFFDYTEAEETENEESITSSTINSLQSYISAFSHAQQLNNLSSKLQKEVNSFNYIVCQPSTKLHIRLEVFII